MQPSASPGCTAATVFKQPAGEFRDGQRTNRNGKVDPGCSHPLTIVPGGVSREPVC
jgi:hypothetical protein